MISTVYFWVFGRKSSLQSDGFGPHPPTITGVCCLVLFPFWPTLNITAILIFPKEGFLRVTPLYQNLQQPPVQQTVQISDPGIQGSREAFPGAPASSGILPDTPCLCSNPTGLLSHRVLHSHLTRSFFFPTFTYTNHLTWKVLSPLLPFLEDTGQD